eukprot:5703287-Pyramimonas_sp.AAC.1
MGGGSVSEALSPHSGLGLIRPELVIHPPYVAVCQVSHASSCHGVGHLIPSELSGAFVRP